MKKFICIVVLGLIVVATNFVETKAADAECTEGYGQHYESPQPFYNIPPIVVPDK